MSTKTVSGATAIVGAVAALLTNAALAQVHPEKPTYRYEKCYGVSRGGMNDCFFAGNSCAGTAAQDNLPGAWVYVPQGTCKKISGGTLEPPKQT
jgi:uncharacterized membrane protein